ncbi:RhuM family protein [Megasphaera cerevisiae]|jgi:hypothetical protein|uniref:RhuM family protein n=1 Tax=Megasphaera cerevisiae TaxID=39029 RepID=UPI000A40057A|nr:RhuM family protein [Megasphaera cerevisiae]
MPYSENMDDIIIYNTEDGHASVRLYANDGTVWMTQAQIAELFDKERSGISKHIKNIFQEGELDPKSNVSFFHIANSDKPISLYSLDMVLAIGFRVRSPRGTQFRKWANATLKEYLQKGFILDSDRLKNPDGRPDYFDELLAQIRDIRASEKRFYQKLRDLFSLSVDYDKTDVATQQFYAETQNKLIYGVTGQTAMELIINRADAKQPNMALTSWKGSVVRKQDIYTAKNYLASDELDVLNRLVSIFLESAELRTKMHKTLTLTYWRHTVDKLLTDHDIPVLHTAGSRSREQMKSYVNTEYDEFENRRKRHESQLADEQDLKELEAETISIQKNKKREL